MNLIFIFVSTYVFQIYTIAVQNGCSMYSCPLNNTKVGATNPLAVKNPPIIFHLSFLAEALSLWIQPSVDHVLQYIFTGEKSLHVSKPTQFNPSVNKRSAIFQRLKF